ncbi:transmembrane protein 115 [Neocloeon triangulifer]|uniref:transmembrane protein 115 n=1 Tax=Neocloeon triangulifer TaxID=2078957 RepID=UPI00286F669F|nr:transmembrane protein 115 [Neocloeon triangulifer]
MATFKTVSRNLPFVKQQLGALTSNTSIFFKLISSLTVCCYFLSYSDYLVQILSVTPGYFLPPTFRIYSAFTFCFLELHLWELLIDVLTLVLCGKLIEPLWGLVEMLIFFGVVNLSVAVLSAFFYLFLYMCTSNTELLFEVHIHGLAGYIAALSVAVKQIMPEHLVFRSPIGKITNRNIPLSVLGLSLILYLIGLIEGTYPTMYACGFLVSWTYLRFYQRHSNGTRGDMAESFCFANFFPNVVQPPIAVIGNTIHGLLVSAGLCQKPVRKYDLGASTAITISLPGSEPQDQDRRREKALKALSERLSKFDPSATSSVAPAPAWQSKTAWVGSSSSSKPNVKSVTIAVPEVTPSSEVNGPGAAAAAVMEAVGLLDSSSDKEPLITSSSSD